MNGQAVYSGDLLGSSKDLYSLFRSCIGFLPLPRTLHRVLAFTQRPISLHENPHFLNFDIKYNEFSLTSSLLFVSIFFMSAGEYKHLGKRTRRKHGEALSEERCMGSERAGRKGRWQGRSRMPQRWYEIKCHRAEIVPEIRGPGHTDL